MSGAISEAVAAAIADPTPDNTPPLTDPVTPPATPEPAAVPDATAATPEPAADPAAAAPDANPDPAPDPKPAKAAGDRRFAVLTAKLSAKDQEVIDLAARLKAAEELLAAKPTPETPAPTPAAAPSGETVEQAAARLIAQRDYDTRRATLIADGTKEFGKEAWDEKTTFLHEVGATANPAFMQALIELPGATKVVAHLADNPDVLTKVLAKGPVAMAAEMGRLDAELTRPAPAPRLSSAPRPAAPLAPAAVIIDHPIDDDAYWATRPAREWDAAWDRHQAAKRQARRA